MNRFLRAHFLAAEAADAFPVIIDRRVFSAVLAVTLLLTIGLVYADIFVFSGEIFERGLAIWRLDIFYQERFAYTLAFAGGIVHPILFIIAGVGLLCLPPPKDGFTMR